MKYQVIDTDPAMQYEAGEEVMGAVEAGSPSEAIAKVMKALGVDVLKTYNAYEYETIVLKYIKAIPAQGGA